MLIDIEKMDFSDDKMDMSSAYWMTLMRYKLKRIGEITAPLGTPVLTFLDLDCLFLKLTLDCLPLR